MVKIMKKLMCFILFFMLCSAVFTPVHALPLGKKYLVFLVDGGNKGVSAETIAVLNRYPGLKLSVAWPQGLKPSAEVLALVKTRRVEPVLTLVDEPVLPLLYELHISSPAVDFSWQEDAWNIIARSQEDYRANFQIYAQGLYLRSGLFSRELIPGLKKLGLTWVTANDRTDENRNAALMDGFVVLSATAAPAAAPQEFWRQISGRQESLLVLRFDAACPLSPELLSIVAENMAKAGNYVMVTPGEIPAELRTSLPVIGQWNGFDAAQWTVRPAVWYKLAIARKAIADYLNSGSADMRMLEMLRNEMYQLYRYETLAIVLSRANPEKDRVFMAGLENIYRLMKTPLPEEIGETIDALPDAMAAEQTMPNIEIRPDAFTVTNASFDNRPLAIENFTVALSSDTITYSVTAGSGVPAGPFFVDIYLDLNNQRGAGLSQLLPGDNAFMQPEDAWEYALRIDRYQAALYRAGRAEPVLVRTFMVNRRYVIEIPRSVLRGNPLRWGYQVVTLSRQNHTAWTIEDFLSGDPKTKAALLQQTPKTFPAIRAVQ
jgi:hypothetical protein